MHNGRWDDPHTRTLAMHLGGSSQESASLFVVLNGNAVDTMVTLPALSCVRAFELLWDSADERPATDRPTLAPGSTTRMTEASLRVYAARA
jgi:glycogen operon protein